jgi:tRNA A-37 threonylcarbamoyl transferase component Bud32
MTPENKQAQSIKLKTDGEASAACKGSSADAELLAYADQKPILPTKDEVVIQYRPYHGVEKWVKYRFSTWSTAKAWIAMTFVVLFFGFGGPSMILNVITTYATSHAAVATVAGATVHTTALNQTFLQGLFSFFAILSAALGVVYVLNPTHISLSARGVCLEWHRWKFSRGLLMPWSRIANIELQWPPGKTSPQDCLILFRDSQNNSAAIKLRLGALGTIEERERLLNAIEKWGKDVNRDATLIEMLTPAQDHSYTELWLQALTAPPRRERLTPLAPGAVLREGKYEIVQQLGVGGQGTAYLAEVAGKSQDVVLKEFILPVYVDVNVRRQALEKMQNEAAMLRRLDNPRVVRLLEFFVEDHRGYLVLELIDGYSLKKVVDDDGRMTETRVKELALQMCEILAYLHSLTPPVVHRDFTPDNLILGKDGILKLVDFNVAQQSDSTSTGTVVGKHSYISPEQFRGKPNPQSDIYAMGATLYYLLLGEDPMPITCSHPVRLRPEISPEMDAIIARATMLDTSKRYQNIAELKADLLNSAKISEHSKPS